MKKVFCDVCGKEMNMWKKDFSFPLDKWRSSIDYEGRTITDLCCVCHSKINEFILDLIEEV